MAYKTPKTKEAQQVRTESPQQPAYGVSQLFMDNRPETVVQRKFQDLANQSSSAQKIDAFQKMANQSALKKSTIVQKKENKTGLPDALKNGIEHLSGYAMDDVKVHYNSHKPAQLQAHAYAQGTSIYIASGQEKHLAHEAWHVVQQKQGRVKPTLQLKTNVSINNDSYLEKEADIMGQKVIQSMSYAANDEKQTTKLAGSSTGIVVQRVLSTSALNVVGEDHNVSGGERRIIEKGYCEQYVGGTYWTEDAFQIDVDGVRLKADPTTYRFLSTLHSIARLTKDLEKPYKADRHNYYQNLIQIYLSSGSAIPALIALAEKLWAETQEVAYPSPLTGRDIEVLRERFMHLQNFKHQLTVLHSFIGKKVTQQLKVQFKNIYEQLGDARRTMMNEIDPEEELNLLRSKAMHYAAQKKSLSIGVWKIGETHVTDILENLNLLYPRLYNLVTEEQFDTYMAANPDVLNVYENPTPSEAQERGLYKKKKRK